MQKLIIKRLSIGSIFKLNFIGMLAGFMPLMILFGILGAAGMDTVTLNDQPVTGLAALVVAPTLGIFIAIIFTLLLSPVMWLGQLIFSRIKPVTISYKAD